MRKKIRFLLVFSILISVSFNTFICDIFLYGSPYTISLDLKVWMFIAVFVISFILMGIGYEAGYDARKEEENK